MKLLFQLVKRVVLSADVLRLRWMQGSLMLLGSIGTLALAEDQVDFNRDIRPILSENCFVCHGPDEGQRQAKLRLDLREQATQPAESGARAIVAKDTKSSQLIARITATDKELRMPPMDSEKHLSAKQIELLTRWIEQGAPYSQHWAFIAPQRPEVTAANEDSWSRNPIDRFVLAKLKDMGLTPAVEATKETLIRRATLDLTGLPPTLAEIDAYLADETEDAYERMLDRLFLSPHYGERMALKWLDIARYADSNGYQSDGSRDIWAWRDWAIDAFNRNLPYDQFTVEQLAGDMLPNPTREQIIATGFNRNHRLNGEGGRIVEEWFVETVIDRVETTGLTWLGLTFNCCRCHDHKYDPISQREFYQLFAYFNSVDESGVLAPAGKNGENTPPLLTIKTAEDENKIATLEANIAKAKESLKSIEDTLPQLIAAWELSLQDRLKQPQSVWTLLNPQSVRSVGGATLTRQNDGTYLASGENPASDEYEIEAPLECDQLSGLLLEVLPDSSLPNQSLGRATNGNFVLTDVEALLIGDTKSKPVEIKFTMAKADYEQSGWTAQSIIGESAKPASKRERKKKQTGWAVDGNDPEKRLARQIMFVADKPVAVPKGAQLRIVMRHHSQFGQHNVGRFRWSVSSTEVENITLNGEAAVPQNVVAALAIPTNERTAEQVSAIREAFMATANTPLKKAAAEVSQAEKQLSDFRDALATTMVMKEGKPRDAFVLFRGEYDKPRDKVTRGLPAILPPMPEGQSQDRLGLARWIVDPANPLTARVWVNRQWEMFMGTGLVKTTENLGSQAEFPSHPELLDWLACEFREPTVTPKINGSEPRAWDMKAFQKLLMMSSTYRQSTQVTPEKVELDPENRFLSRGPRFRLPGELIRDQALAVSGLLISKVGGPSVRPYMPDGVWDETSKYGDLRNYKHDAGDGLYRRTMYTIWKRTAAPPTMLLFDAPNREICTVKRSRTNTPLQALSLLNEVTFVEAARGLAARMLSEGGSTHQERLVYGFRSATGRRPTERELQILVKGLEQDLAHFQQHVAAAQQLIAVGDSKADAALPVSELAAYSLTANVLLNLDECVTRE